MLSGTVTDKSGKAVAGAAVVLFPPIDLRMDLFSYKTATANAQGQFSIAGIRPGTYTAFAIAEKLEANASISMTQYLNYGTPIEVGKNQRLLQGSDSHTTAVATRTPELRPTARLVLKIVRSAASNVGLS
jgi:hypothetical protein